MEARASALLGMSVLLAAGCAVGPDYEEPKTTVPGAYEQAGKEGLSPDPIAVAWWRAFEDPTLDGLIDRALERNRGVLAATALLREARALYAQETFDLAPTVTARAGYTRQLQSSAVMPAFSIPRDRRTFGFWSAGFDAAWELDLFGRARRGMEAASAEVDAVEASRRDVVVTLMAEVARNYFELQGARYRLEVARKNEQVEEETLKLTVARFEGGRGTDLDVARARAELQSTRAILPPIEAEAARARNRLAVLLGEVPSGFALELAKPGPLERLPLLVTVGKPEDLLRRRPDIREAERRLASATAQIGVATADLFPRLSFTGTFGPQAQTLPGLFKAGSGAYSFGPGLTWAALDLGRVAARIRAADARAEAELGRYEETVLVALEETENALVGFGRERARRDALQEAVAAGERAASLADARFQSGAADFLTALDAQRTALNLQLQLAESQARTVTALIALYKALGGGWEYEADLRARPRP
jgi:NodT family efflux transporter outer membrane factor (OMF) lipoprotein